MTKHALEPIIGRYVNLEISGVRQRIYFESAGEGQPLLCLHTAGADGRQFRHLMNDAELTKNHRVVAFDMPMHGKSLPPDGWRGSDYKLSSQAYVETILTFCKTIELEHPIVLGCSMGGRVALRLAARHADAFAGFIAIAGAAFSTPWYDPSWTNRTDLDGGEVAAGLVEGLMAPQSDPDRRWEVLWGYLQSARGIFAGDLNVFRDDPPIVQELAQIDAGHTPLILICGAYDFSITPENTRQTAQAIKGAHVIEIAQVGHFPMTEAPEIFRAHLQDALGIISNHTRISGESK